MKKHYRIIRRSGRGGMFYRVDLPPIGWRIAEPGGAKRSWREAGLVPALMKGDPLPAREGARWCFLETTSDPRGLRQTPSSLSVLPPKDPVSTPRR